MLLELFGRTLKLDLGEHDGKEQVVEDVCWARADPKFEIYLSSMTLIYLTLLGQQGIYDMILILILIVEVIVRYQIEASCPKDRLCRLWQIVDEMLLNSWRSRRSVIGGSSGRPIDSRKAREYTIISWARSLGSRRVYIVCSYLHTLLLKSEIQ